MLKIGMIGAGFVAGFHERALCSVRGAEFAGVYALQGAEALAEQARGDGLGKTQVFDNIAQMCEAVDVVCIFAPNPFHVEIMRHTIALNGSFFNTQRMVEQYVLKAYSFIGEDWPAGLQRSRQ